MVWPALASGEVRFHGSLVLLLKEAEAFKITHVDLQCEAFPVMKRPLGRQLFLKPSGPKPANPAGGVIHLCRLCSVCCVDTLIWNCPPRLIGAHLPGSSRALWWLRRSISPSSPSFHISLMSTFRSCHGPTRNAFPMFVTLDECEATEKVATQSIKPSAFGAWYFSAHFSPVKP